MAAKPTSSKKRPTNPATKASALAAPHARSAIGAEEARFAEVIALIETARARGYQAVNAVLVEHYWDLGEYISRKIATAEWGDGVVKELAADLARRYPGVRGYTRPNLFRMRQFYEAYRHDRKVSALLRQLNTRLVRALNLRVSRVSSNIGDAFRSSIDKSIERATRERDTILSTELIESLIAARTERLEGALTSDQWMREFRGRDVLREFVSTEFDNVSYEHFRNLVIARMKDEKYQPPGMLAILDQLRA